MDLCLGYLSLGAETNSIKCCLNLDYVHSKHYLLQHYWSVLCSFM